MICPLNCTKRLNSLEVIAILRWINLNHAICLHSFQNTTFIFDTIFPQTGAKERISFLYSIQLTFKVIYLQRHTYIWLIWQASQDGSLLRSFHVMSRVWHCLQAQLAPNLQEFWIEKYVHSDFIYMILAACYHRNWKQLLPVASSISLLSCNPAVTLQLPARGNSPG